MFRPQFSQAVPCSDQGLRIARLGTHVPTFHGYINFIMRMVTEEFVSCLQHRGGGGGFLFYFFTRIPVQPMQNIAERVAYAGKCAARDSAIIKRVVLGKTEGL